MTTSPADKVRKSGGVQDAKIASSRRRHNVRRSGLDPLNNDLISLIWLRMSDDDVVKDADIWCGSASADGEDGTSRNQALFRMLQLFYHVAGEQYTIEPSMLEGETALENLLDSMLIKHSSGHRSQYVLVGSANKRFKHNLDIFVSSVFRSKWLSSSDDLLNMFSIVVLDMCECRVRAIRHTGIFVGLKIMDGLIKAESDQQQQQQKLIIARILNALSKGVLWRGMMDVSADIRWTCMDQLGIWFARKVKRFLNDEHFRFVGWGFFDKTSDCRVKALEIAGTLLSATDNIAKFFERFQKRILAMTIDRDANVCSTAIDLIGKILSETKSKKPNVKCEFSDTQIDSLCGLVYHANLKIARTAGKLLMERISMTIETGITKKSREDARLVNFGKLKELVKFAHDHNPFAVTQSARNACLIDVLWLDHKGLFSDFKSLFDFVSENVFIDSPLSISCLLDLVACCAERAVAGHSVIHRISRRAPPEACRAARSEVLFRAEAIFADLFIRFYTEPEMILCLVRIVDTFPDDDSLPQVIVSRIIREYRECLKRNSDHQVITSIARSLELLKIRNSKCLAEIDSLLIFVLDSYTSSLKAALNAVDDKLTVYQADKQICAKIAEQIQGPLLRLECLTRYHLYARYDHWDKPLIIAKNPNFDQNLRRIAIGILVNNVQWSLFTLVDKCATGQAILDERKRQYKQIMDDKEAKKVFERANILLFDVIEPILTPQGQPASQLAIHALWAMFDILNVFELKHLVAGIKHEWKPKSFVSEHYPQEISLLASKVCEFVCESIVNACESGSASKSSKRSSESSSEEKSILERLFDCERSLEGIERLMKDGVFPVGLYGKMSLGRFIRLYANPIYSKKISTMIKHVFTEVSQLCQVEEMNRQMGRAIAHSFLIYNSDCQKNAGGRKRAKFSVERIVELIALVKENRICLIELYKTCIHWHSNRQKLDESVMNALIELDCRMPLAAIDDRFLIAGLIRSDASETAINNKLIHHFSVAPTPNKHPGMITSTPAPARMQRPIPSSSGETSDVVIIWDNSSVAQSKGESAKTGQSEHTKKDDSREQTQNSNTNDSEHGRVIDAKVLLDCEGFNRP